MGSVTTAVACVQLDRRYIGMEMNEEYIAISKERLLATGMNTPNLFVRL
jgi:DNA modification methylase